MENIKDTRNYINDILGSENLVITKAKNKGSEHHEKIDKSQFVDKLCRTQQAVDINNLLDEFSWEERYEWIIQKKLKGNRMFKAGKFADAADIYLTSLNGLSFNNKIEEAIKIDNSNAKAYYVRGKSHMLNRDYESSEKDLVQAVKFSQNNIQQQNDIRTIFDQMKEQKRKEQQAFGKFFQNGQKDQQNDDTDSESENERQQKKNQIYDAYLNPDKDKKILYINDDFEKLRNFGVLKYAIYPIQQAYKLASQNIWCKRRINKQQPQIKKQNEENDEDYTSEEDD